MPRSQALLEALLALIGDMCLLPYTYMGICHAVQGDAGLYPGHHGVRPGSAGRLHCRVPLPGAHMCVHRELGTLWWTICVLDCVFRFQMEALQAVWGYCSVYPIVWLHPIRSLSLTLSLSLFLYFSLFSLPLRQVPGSGASTPSDQGTPRRAGSPLAGQAHLRQQVTRGSPCRR